MARPTKKYVLVRAAKFEHYTNVLFMMDATDFRLSDERFSGNYTILGEGAYDRRAGTLTVDGHAHTVFHDWSVKDEGVAA